MGASDISSSGNYFWHQGYRYSNKNYYHVSFLTVIAKIFEKYASKEGSKLVYGQISFKISLSYFRRVAVHSTACSQFQKYANGQMATVKHLARY